jgi:hypothetical protein
MWLHDIPLSALAAAVATLGVVIWLELRSIRQLRRSVDINLARVFEQLEILRAESRQLLQAQALAQRAAERAAPVVTPAKQPAAERQTLDRPLTGSEPTLDYVGPPSAEVPVYDAGSTAARSLPAGEARLLASLAAARARLEQANETDATPEGAAPGEVNPET